MDGVLALGHFCESHGPCVILSTQRSTKEPEQLPHSLRVPVCESCHSLDLDQALVSKDEKCCYVTTRTPLQQDLAFLLKQAVFRSLSCEETNKDDGAIYFGDDERGHVISHNFALQDSLARGFFRKYSILLLMKDKIHLLNSWTFITEHIKRISRDLQDKAARINNTEQARCSQRAVRQAQGSPMNPARSLSQLTGEPAVFAHLHLWFTWIISVETVVEKPPNVPEFPANCSKGNLREVLNRLPENIFKTICYCILTGIKVESNDSEILNVLKQLLPKKFTLPSSGDICKLELESNEYLLKWRGCLPSKLPTLLVLVVEALNNKNIADSVLEPFLTSLVMQWYNIACAVCWAPTTNTDLFNVLGVQKWDMPLLSYWVPQCDKITVTHI